MGFKRFLFDLLLNMIIFSFVVVLTRSVVLPIDTIYLLISLLVVGAAALMYDPILRFLTVKKNFLTQWVVVSVFVFLAVYLLNSLMPMFTVQGFATKSEFLQLSLSGTMTIAFVSVFMGLLSSIFGVLKD
jgi:hypothetical protein